MRWRCGNRGDPQWRCWEAEKHIIFNAGSAHTHHLNQLAVDILAIIKDQPLDFSDLCKRLSQIYEDLEIDAEIDSYIQETLVLLDDIGLIEPELM